jgi:predicted O-linked N-acetylglucosamine transferase (SPINDLY family)
MFPKSKLVPVDYQNELLVYSLNNNSRVAIKLKKDFENWGKVNTLPILDDTPLKKWIDDFPSAIAPLLIIANLCEHTRLQHVQWMYINYANQIFIESEELIELKNYSKELLLNVFPFARDLEEYLLYIEKNYTCSLNQKIIINDIKSAIKLFDNARNKNNKILALAIAIKSVRMYKTKFIYSMAFILLEMKKVNEALKSLILLTLFDPLGKEQLALWGKISVEMTSTRNYWVSKLGYILYPNDPAIMINLSGAVNGIGAYKEAKSVLEKTLSIFPNECSALINYANIIASEGRPADAVILLNKAQKYEKKYSGKIDSNILLFSQYDNNVDYIKLKRLHIEKAAKFEKLNSFKALALKTKNKEYLGKIKVGFVSYDLFNHPVSYYLYPLIKNIDTSQIDVSIFYNQHREDNVTKIFRELVPNNWFDISSRSTFETHKLIVEKNIDILIDLSGHTAGNRLDLFSNRSAPIQCTYLGYPFTTGIKEIDYRFSDHTNPDDTNYFTEKRINVNPSAYCYQPLISRMELIDSQNFKVQLPPVLKNGYITFGASTNPAKLNEIVIEVWSKILKNNNNSKLMIEANGMSDYEYSSTFTKKFEKFGISHDRLILRQRDPRLQYLIYNDIDIALDPFPYGGGTSTLDLLWMGVPLITLKGKAGMSLVGASYLSHLGEDNWIAKDITEYIYKSTELANDISQLNIKRSNQREKMNKSPLMDGETFGKAFTKVFNELAHS